MASSEPERHRQRSQQIALAVFLTGVGLLGCSFLPAFASGSTRWSSDQARQYQDASMQIQKLTHQLAQQSPDTATQSSSVEFKKALDHFQQLQGELSDARSQSGIWAMTLRVVGVVLGIAGITNLIAATPKQ